MAYDMLNALFGYHPNKPAAVIALLAYAAAACVSIYLNIKTRTRYTWIVAVTAIFEAGGYAARLYVSSHPTVGAYVIHQLLLVITPTLLAIAAYMMSGRMMLMADSQKMGCLSASKLSTIFAWSDALALVLQFSGGGLLVATDPKMVEMGDNLLMVGLAAQLVFFALFTMVTIRLATAPQYGLSGRPGAARMFNTLYITIGLLTVRNIYRVAEFAQGFGGSIASNEALFYIFDSVLIFAAICALLITHPGTYLPRIAAGLSSLTTPKEALESKDARMLSFPQTAQVSPV